MLGAEQKYGYIMPNLVVCLLQRGPLIQALEPPGTVHPYCCRTVRRTPTQPTVFSLHSHRQADTLHKPPLAAGGHTPPE